MVRSMTGYGRAVTETGQKKITVEIKSLNSKQLDISTKIPWIYKEKEIDIRTIISQSAGRGKVDIIITLDQFDEEVHATINRNAVKNYLSQLKEIASENSLAPDDTQLLQIIMRLPESVRSEKTELPEDEWVALKNTIGEALLSLDAYRAGEGKALETDMAQSADRILEYLDKIEPFEKERITRVREKIDASFADLNLQAQVDRNRFEQELIYYLEKLDVNEEKVRLRKHCDYFRETLGSADANGRTLGFIAQEMGREINTIGSKANHAAIQKLVVMMKEELEKIKEQALNVL